MNPSHVLACSPWVTMGIRHLHPPCSLLHCSLALPHSSLSRRRRPDLGSDDICRRLQLLLMTPSPLEMHHLATCSLNSATCQLDMVTHHIDMTTHDVASHHLDPRCLPTLPSSCCLMARCSLHLTSGSCHRLFTFVQLCFHFPCLLLRGGREMVRHTKL